MTTDRPESPKADLATEVEKLVKQGDLTVDSVNLLRRAIDRNTRTWRISIVVGAVLILVLALTLVDARRAIHTLQRQICPIVELSIPKQGDAPPTSQHGRDVIDASERLAKHLHCASGATTDEGH